MPDDISTVLYNCFRRGERLSLHQRSKSPDFLGELVKVLLNQFEAALEIPVDVGCRRVRIRLLSAIVAQTIVQRSRFTGRRHSEFLPKYQLKLLIVP